MPRRPQFVVKRDGFWVLDFRINDRRVRKRLGKIGEVDYPEALECGLNLREKEMRGGLQCVGGLQCYAAPHTPEGEEDRSLRGLV